MAVRRSLICRYMGALSGISSCELKYFLGQAWTFHRRSRRMRKCCVTQACRGAALQRIRHGGNENKNGAVIGCAVATEAGLDPRTPLSAIRRSRSISPGVSLHNSLYTCAITCQALSAAVTDMSEGTT